MKVGLLCLPFQNAQEEAEWCAGGSSKGWLPHRPLQQAASPRPGRFPAAPKSQRLLFCFFSPPHAVSEVWGQISYCCRPSVRYFAAFSLQGYHIGPRISTPRRRQQGSPLGPACTESYFLHPPFPHARRRRFGGGANHPLYIRLGCVTPCPKGPPHPHVAALPRQTL